MEYVLVGIGVLLMVITVLPWLNSTKWWIRSWDFPRMQISVLAMTILLLYSIYYFHVNFWSLLFTGALAGIFVYQIVRIFPYTRFVNVEIKETRECDPRNTLSIMTCNIYMKNKKTELFKALIQKYHPDIALVVEADNYWASELENLKETYPYHRFVPQANTYGMILFSKLELKNTSVKFLVEKDIPSIEADVVLASGEVIKLYCLHPAPPVPYSDPNENRDADTEERDAELLIVGKKVKKEGKPAIVVGDLNDVAWSSTTNLFQKVSGMLDPRVGRFMCNSFHAKNPLMRYPLDHFFLTRHFTYDILKRLEPIDSDHFPIYIKCTFNNIAKKQQEEKQATHEEQKKADERIYDGLYNKDKSP